MNILDSATMLQFGGMIVIAMVLGKALGEPLMMAVRRITSRDSGGVSIPAGCPPEVAASMRAIAKGVETTSRGIDALMAAQAEMTKLVSSVKRETRDLHEWHRPEDGIRFSWKRSMEDRQIERENQKQIASTLEKVATLQGAMFQMLADKEHREHTGNTGPIRRPTNPGFDPGIG